MEVSQGRVQWLALVLAVLNVRVCDQRNVVLKTAGCAIAQLCEIQYKLILIGAGIAQWYTARLRVA
jgi:hypothetical protein